MTDPTIPISSLIELYAALALMCGLFLGWGIGVVFGYYAGQPSRQERRTLRRALDQYLLDDGLSVPERQDANHLRYSSTLKER